MQEQYYEEYYRAELTHWWFSARRHIIASLLDKYAAPFPSTRVADVGCGMGASFPMLGRFGSVLGVDFSTTALALSRQRGHRRLVAAGLPFLPFADAHFDIVCAFDVIEHIEDDRAAARELWRVCRPGGLLVVTVPAYRWLWSEHDDINEHKRRYTRSELAACLTQIGCRVLKLSYMNTLLAPPLMAFRVLKNLLGRRDRSAAPRSDVFPVAAPVNAVLRAVFSSEAAWLRVARFPFGISLICVARKNEN